MSTPTSLYSYTSNTLTTNLLSIGGIDVIGGLISAPSLANIGTVNNTNGNVILHPKSPTGIIDVRGDFVWTVSPKKGVLPSIPCVFLTERSQETNSLISSALYYVTSFINGIGGSTNNLDKESSNKIITYITTLISSSLGSTATGSSFESTMKALQSKLQKLVSSFDDQSLLSYSKSTLKSYIGIYLTKKTGFRYILPYFGSDTMTVTNSWGSQSQERPLISKKYMELVETSVDQAAATLNVLQPGTFIEKPRYFQYPSEGESITIKFPLLNTYNPGDSSVLPYQQNYELLWMLAYQNKPYRTSFSRILPPKIYTLSIPGIKSMPYCYISNMSVEFQGTKRILPVAIPSNDRAGTTITAPIPEAYVVSITFTGLLADIGNMMASPDFGNKINTGVLSLF